MRAVSHHARTVRGFKHINASKFYLLHFRALKEQTTRQERNSLREIAAAAKTSAQKAFDDHVNTVCRTLCNVVHAKFPREVRNIIYGFLFHSTTVQVAESYFKIDAVPARCDAPTHLWNAQMLGEDMHREFCEHFFRSIRFDCLDNFKLLAEFRTTDQ